MKAGWIWFGVYLGCIVGANWLIVTFGPQPVGFGLVAPAGVYVVGLSFLARDYLQDAKGRAWTVGAIVGGALLSALLTGPALGLASGAAFLLSEGADMAVYTPLRERGHWLAGVVASNTVGLVVDSALFLTLAFGSLAYLPGQIIGKAWVTAAFLAGYAGLRWLRARIARRAVA